MIVADTSAFMAVLRREEDAGRIADRASFASVVFVSAATKVEIGLVVFSRFGEDGMERMEGLMRAMCVAIDPVDLDQSEAAIAAFKRFGRGSGHPAKLNFGDCFSYALAKSRDLPLLFKGEDFIHTDIRSAMECV